MVDRSVSSVGQRQTHSSIAFFKNRIPFFKNRIPFFENAKKERIGFFLNGKRRKKTGFRFAFFEIRNPVFLWWKLLGFFKNGLRFFCVFSIFLSKKRNCFEKCRRLPDPVLILKEFSGFSPALHCVFDPKTDTNANCRKKIKPFFPAFFRIV